jgi:phosphate transport system substrate-binding protein
MQHSSRTARRRFLHCLALGSLGVIAARPGRAASAQALTVQAAGATFPSKLYMRWATRYTAQAGVVVHYTPSGSGDGIQRAMARSVDFAGTDAPLSAADLATKRLVQIPTCVGGVVPVVNGFENGRLRLSGDVLGDIFGGAIQRWDDPRIAALNPGVPLPALRIRRIVRADKSGTTEGLTRYLALVSASFKQKVGESALPDWPGEIRKAEGNDGVAAAVRETSGAIGYVSYDRVAADRLAAVTLRNHDGAWVAPSETGFRSAILHSDLYRNGQDLASLADRPGADSWPITMTTFVLVDAAPASREAVEPALRFLYWCFMHGDLLTQGTGFAPLPVSVQAKLAARFAAVRPQTGGMPNYLGV